MVLRNRTAELCAQNEKVTYMTVKRKLSGEFGPDVYETHKLAVQGVFRAHATRGEGLQVKAMRMRTGEVRRKLK